MEKKADFKTMKKREIVGFIWDYYKWYFIIGIIAIAFVVSLVRHFMAYKDPVAQLVFVNCDTGKAEEEGTPDFKEFMEMYGYDMKEEEVTVNTEYKFSLDSTSSEETQLFQSFLVMGAGGGMEILAVDDDAELFQFIGGCRLLADLSEYLSEDLMEKYADNIIYAEDEETGSTFPVGIRLEQNEWMEEHGYYTDGCIIGVASGTTHGEAAKRMLLYLLQEEDEEL